MEPHIVYEHVFCNPIDHRAHSNEYIYKFPEHFSNSRGRKEIGLRSVTIKNASRDLKLQHIFFKSDAPVNVNISFSVSLSSNDNMSDANNKFKKAIKTKYIEYKDEIENIRLSNPNTPNHFGINDYTIEYVHSSNEFWIKVLKQDSEHPCYINVSKADTYMSDDLKSILDIDDELFSKIALMQSGELSRAQLNDYLATHTNVILRYNSNDANDTKLTGIGFTNVWNRDTIYITSTLSTLAEDKYLTLSNIEHSPLKYYDLTSYASTFSLYLYDADKKNNVELPRDNKDLMLIEMIVCAY